MTCALVTALLDLGWLPLINTKRTDDERESLEKIED
jgi:hypothetical protein